MRLVLQTADVAGAETNCLYPNRVEVSTPEDLREAVKMDHVCGEYEKNYRSIKNFLRTNVVVMDIDNDHSEDPEDWITPEKLDELMGDLSYAIAFSRHHMKDKHGVGPRPRMHVYFETGEITDADEYKALKVGIHQRWDFFDGNALDAARFIYGADVGECIWHEGWLTVDEEVEPVYEEEGTAGGSAGSSSGPILQGSRNNTMSRFAIRVLKRYGDTDKAKEAFLEHAEKCDPPLPDRELSTIWHSAQKFYNKVVVKQPDYVPPDKYNEEFGGYLKPEDYTDMDEAKVLVREYGEELKYSPATGYIRYDGRCWIEDEQLAVGAVEEFLDLQIKDAKEEVASVEKALIQAGIPKEIVMAGEKEIAKVITQDTKPLLFMLIGANSYRKFVLKRRDYKYITATANTAKPMVGVNVSDLDKDENLLNTPYATFDLKKGLTGVQPHDPKDLITKITSCSPDDKGKKLWDDCLDLFFCGDKQLIEYVQMVVGMAAIGKVYQEHMIIAYGGGANGKSTFWNTIFRVMGTYAGKLSAESLTMKCKRNIMPELAELKGRRLIISSEMQEGMRLNTSVVKQLCSTDEIQAEKKYKAPFHFVPSHTLVLYTNHLPKVGANDDGIWRRLVVIPFNAKIEGDSDIKNYADYLYDHAGGYVMKWIIEGAGKAIAADFKTPLPKVVQEAINKYREDNNWMGQFIDDCCDTGGDKSEKSGKLYQAYRSYCASNAEFARSTSDFYAALENAGFNRKRTKEGSMVYGLTLKEGQDFL